MTKQYDYTSVIEFFQHDEAELQDRIQVAEDIYYQLVANYDNQLAANIRFHESPFPVALNKLLAYHDAGYIVKEDRFCGLQGGTVDLTLTKPKAEIDRDLAQVHKRATDEYHADRYARNVLEQERQLAISIDRARRDADKARAAAEQAELEAQRQRALADLKAAYAA